MINKILIFAAGVVIGSAVTWKCIKDSFMDRQYEANGEGGLFTIRNVGVDLTKVDIWTQLCWYLDSIS